MELSRERPLSLRPPWSGRIPGLPTLSLAARQGSLPGRQSTVRGHLTPQEAAVGEAGLRASPAPRAALHTQAVVGMLVLFFKNLDLLFSV